MCRHQGNEDDDNDDFRKVLMVATMTMMMILMKAMFEHAEVVNEVSNRSVVNYVIKMTTTTSVTMN